jgi:hypothetical protein
MSSFKSIKRKKKIGQFIREKLYLCWGGGGAKYCPKKYNIDYFGYAANL